MKKILAITLCVMLLLPMFSGCNAEEIPEENTKNHTLQVGFGRVDISPKEPVPLRGYGNTSERISTEVMDPLYASCIAFTDEAGNTVLQYHIDLPNCYDDLFLFARSKVSKAVGISMNNIMMACTHMHSGPDTTNLEFQSIVNYNESLQKWLVEAAELALADRKTAQMYISRAYPKNMNFVRHYLMDDGTVAGDGFGVFTGKTIVKHMTDADNELQVIKFTREGGKDVILANWQGHPHRAGMENGKVSTKVTADIVGAMRSEMEKRLDCYFAYFTGASGNVNNNGRIAGETITKDHLEHGKILADHAIEALKNAKMVETGTVQIMKQEVQAERKDGSGTTAVQLYAFSVGDVAFVDAPYEMFDTNGMAIKKGSSFEMTFVATCANFHYYYIPSEEAFAYGGEYEIGITRFVRGTAEKLQDSFVDLLNQLYETRK